MNFSRAMRLSVIGSIAMLATAGSASAATVRARLGYDHLVTANIVSEPLSGNVNTVTFQWTRTDAPGPSVDTSISDRFISFCVELEQSIRSNVDYNFEVLTSAQAGYTPEQDLALRLLWASHINDVVGGTSSAAFQLAVWEIRYDTDRNLSTGTFIANSPEGSLTLAQGWLNTLSSTTTLRDLPELRVLWNDDAQDQLTVEIPEPGAGACVMAGLLMLRRRRRK